MFGNRAQCVYREEWQSSHNENNSKSHNTKSCRIRFQSTCTLRNEFLLSQQPGDGHLTYNRNKTTQNKYYTAWVIPKISIISQPFETGTIVGRRSKAVRSIHENLGCSTSRLHSSRTPDDVRTGSWIKPGLPKSQTDEAMPQWSLFSFRGPLLSFLKIPVYALPLIHW